VNDPNLHFRLTYDVNYLVHHHMTNIDPCVYFTNVYLFIKLVYVTIVLPNTIISNKISRRLLIHEEITE